MKEVCLREYGFISMSEKNTHLSDIDHCYVDSKDWLFLERLAFSNRKEDRFIKASSLEGEKSLQVVNFVGVISTPQGTHIEILPKISEQNQDLITSRELLWKMLNAIEKLPFIEATDANLKLFEKSLPEVLINRFLKTLANLVRQGIRKDYQRIESEEKFLKGRLLVVQQLRQSAGKQHLSQIAYDLFSDNRAENRLLHSALIQVANWSKSGENQKLARELRFAFNEVPKSNNYRLDFELWQNTRDMISYRALLPWVRLILNQECPFTIKDQHAGISFLFPMEKLFEGFVTTQLQKYLTPKGYQVRAQMQSHYLSDTPKAFLLKPDIVILDKHKNPIAILDTKWKLINEETVYDNGESDAKSGISQSDMYQMFAYGHKYLRSNGSLVLIYPRWKNFNSRLKQSFTLGDNLILDVVPFDLIDDSKGFTEMLIKIVDSQAEDSSSQKSHSDSFQKSRQ